MVGKREISNSLNKAWWTKHWPPVHGLSLETTILNEFYWKNLALFIYLHCTCFVNFFFALMASSWHFNRTSRICLCMHCFSANYAWIMWIAWYFLVQIFIIKAFKNSLVLLLIPNYTFSKQKQGTEGCFAAKINRNRVLFLSQAVIGYTVLLPIMARVV